MGNIKCPDQHASSAPPRRSFDAPRRRNSRPHPLIAQLADERRARKMTWRALAAKSGIAEDTIYALSSGRQEPYPSTLTLIARPLGLALALIRIEGDEKTCQVCGEAKRWRDFPRNERTRDRRAPYCLACKYEGAVPWSMLRTGRGLPNELRTAARDERLKVYAGYRDRGLQPVEAAKLLAEEFDVTERTAQRYETRYQPGRRTAVPA